MKIMTKEKYKELRKQIGTQQEVAALLDVSYESINRRENGRVRITREAAYALCYLLGLKTIFSSDYGIEDCQNP